jgi:hypothetical protein
MAPSRAAPVSFDLHAVRVGSFVVQAGALLDVPLARDPRLRVDVGRSKASVEMSLPATRGHRRLSHRLARLEYGDETVQWFRLEADGDPAKIGTNHPALVLRLASPPALTAGRVELPPEASDEATSASEKTAGAGASLQTRRRMTSSKPLVAWGTAGKASDFTAGEASRTATAFLCFKDAEAAVNASAALERAWPGKNLKAYDDATETSATSRDVWYVSSDKKKKNAENEIEAASRWLGKRARPDGRVHQPPRKRYAADGPEDPGFVS